MKSIEVAEDGGLDVRINVVETDPDKLTDFRLHIEEKLARLDLVPSVSFCDALMSISKASG